MALVPLGRQIIASPAVQRTISPYLGLVAFNEFARQGRSAARNIYNIAEDVQNLYHKTRRIMPTPQRLFTPRRSTPMTVRRTPLTRTPRRRAAMRRRFRAVRRSPYRKTPITRPIRALMPRNPLISTSVIRSRTKSPYGFCNRVLGSVPGTQKVSKKVLYDSQVWTGIADKSLYTAFGIRVPWDDNESVGTRRSTGTIHLTGIKFK